MTSCRKLFLIILFLTPLLLFASNFLQNREYQNQAVKKCHFSFPSHTEILDHSFHLSMNIRLTENEVIEEKEHQRTTRNRIGSPSVKKFRRIVNCINRISFSYYDIVPRDSIHHPMCLRI